MPGYCSDHNPIFLKKYSVGKGVIGDREAWECGHLARPKAGEPPALLASYITNRVKKWGELSRRQQTLVCAERGATSALTGVAQSKKQLCIKGGAEGSQTMNVWCGGRRGSSGRRIEAYTSVFLGSGRNANSHVSVFL